MFHAISQNSDKSFDTIAYGGRFYGDVTKFEPGNNSLPILLVGCSFAVDKFSIKVTHNNFKLIKKFV